MSRFGRHSRVKEDAELDITAFLNLMIVLVPVLLLSLVFARTTVIDLTLPDLGGPSEQNPDEPKEEQLELIIYSDYMQVNYPAGVLVRRIQKNEETGEHNYKLLSVILQEIKRRLKDSGIDKKDIFVLSQPDTDYQTLIRSMDTVRSYQALVAASIVDAELFPEISLGDAPIDESEDVASAGGEP